MVGKTNEVVLTEDNSNLIVLTDDVNHTYVKYTTVFAKCEKCGLNFSDLYYIYFVNILETKDPNPSVDEINRLFKCNCLPKFKHDFATYFGTSFSIRCARCGIYTATIRNKLTELKIGKPTTELVYKLFPCLTDDEFTIKDIIE